MRPCSPQRKLRLGCGHSLAVSVSTCGANTACPSLWLGVVAFVMTHEQPCPACGGMGASLDGLQIVGFGGEVDHG